jgi:hypothetical protein
VPGDSAQRRLVLHRLTASAIVAACAYALYRATLLPGLDFGDTGAFQDAGGAFDVTPRQAYPLYFAIGNIVVWLAGGEPAFGMNLASAVYGALACGVLTWLAADLSESTMAGIFGGGLFAASYTFWSQAVIAEVYTLHILLVAASLTGLVHWSKRPASLGRLSLFFAVYALGFGNHLMMVLLLPPATLFLALTMPRGVRGLLGPRVVGLALLMATLGALQYAWNFRSMYAGPVHPTRVGDALAAFWFDVTKSDWRSTLVMGIHESALRPRLAMYRFDVTQQFGWIGVGAAVVGLAALARRWRLLALVATGWLAAAAFAYTYNVGDVHVFFLSSHVFVALSAACGVALALAWTRRRLALFVVTTALALAYPTWRAFDTWPAVDRSGDTRPSDLVRAITRDLPSNRALLLADLNWQLQNGLDYYAHHENPDLLHLRAGDRLLTLPQLIDENLRHGRDIVLTRQSARTVTRAFADTWRIEAEPPLPTLLDRVRALPRGMPFVLAVLRATRDVPLDSGELASIVGTLTSGTAVLPVTSVYTVMVGRTGEPPVLVRSEARPYRLRAAVGDLALEVRMESWLPADTIRRAGFGHVVINHRHVLTLERGVSFAALGPDGRARVAGYASCLFAPEPRLRIRATPGA